MRITLEECQKFYSDWLKRGHKQRDPLPTALCKFINNQPTSDVKNSVNQRLVEALENSVKEMELWLESEVCCCEAGGHTCGMPRLLGSIEKAKQALKSSKTFESKEIKLREALEQNVEEGECYCGSHIAIKNPCGWCASKQALEGKDIE